MAIQDPNLDLKAWHQSKRLLRIQYSSKPSKVMPKRSSKIVPQSCDILTSLRSNILNGAVTVRIPVFLNACQLPMPEYIECIQIKATESPVGASNLIDSSRMSLNLK